MDYFEATVGLKGYYWTAGTLETLMVETTLNCHRVDKASIDKLQLCLCHLDNEGVMTKRHCSRYEYDPRVMR